MTHLFGFLLQITIVLTILAGAYALIAKSLRAFLDDATKAPGATEFYLRSLLLLFVCVGITSTAETSISFAKDLAFMEYVWQIDKVLENVFAMLLGIFLVYLIIVTILAAVLRRKNVQ